MKRATKQPDAEPPPDPLAFVHITQAYNRGEITYEQWVEQTRAWAEAVMRHYKGECYTDGIDARRPNSDSD